MGYLLNISGEKWPDSLVIIILRLCHERTTVNDGLLCQVQLQVVQITRIRFIPSSTALAFNLLLTSPWQYPNQSSKTGIAIL